MLERVFRLAENGTSIPREIIAGLTTFLAMAYIIFVQPAVLSGTMFGFQTGMDFGAVTVATCLSAALASAIMGLYGRYPIAQAPGMGENFFFVFTVLPAARAAGFANAWQVALGLVFISGVLFLVLSLLRVREQLLDAISPSMKQGIAVGIGLFIAFIGLQNCGLVIKDPGTALKLNPHLLNPDALVFFFGLILALGLELRGVRGGTLISILGSTVLAVVLKFCLPAVVPGLMATPPFAQSLLATRFAPTSHLLSSVPSIAPTFLKMDLHGALSAAMWPFILVFLFMIVFDTMGTLIGVGEQGGFIRDNRLPRAREAMASDAIGTVIGAALGTSTVTSFIESGAGVKAGGRTGLTALITAALFLVALLFTPLVAMVGSYAPITAPALVLVGAMMAGNVAKIQWDDPSEYFPAFLIMIGIPLSYSIADGVALGFLIYPILKVFSPTRAALRPIHWIIAIFILAYFLLVKNRIG